MPSFEKISHFKVSLKQGLHRPPLHPHFTPAGNPPRSPFGLPLFCMLPGETGKSSSLKGNLCKLCDMKAIGLGLEGYEMEVQKSSVITHLKAELFESWKTSCAGKFDKFMITHSGSGLKNDFWV